ncbi:hypothetical protein V8E36_005190 [Tilletia maclaganii]
MTDPPEPHFRLQHYTSSHPRLPFLRTSLSASSSSSSRKRNAFILISGLGDTIGTLPYTHALAAHLAQRSSDEEEWELIIPTLSSTAGGWGTASLEGDALEIQLLINHLRSESLPPTHIVIQGHSTGCQDLIQLLSSSTLEPKIAAAIFQAPVSDSEDFHHRVVPLAKKGDAASQQAVDTLALATLMVAEGRGNELLPRSHVGVLDSQSSSSSETKATPDDPIIHAPVTAYRFHSLHALGAQTDDDFFSSPRSLSEEFLAQNRLSLAFKNAFTSKTRLLFLFCDQDEYVEASLRTDEATIRANYLDRWGRVADRVSGGSVSSFYRAEVLKGADHAVNDVGAQSQMLGLIGELLDQVEAASSA